ARSSYAVFGCGRRWRMRIPGFGRPRIARVRRMPCGPRGWPGWRSTASCSSPRRRSMKRIMCSRYAAVPLALWLVFVPLLAHAEQFTGKVVGISDGDTISVLREGKAVKVRLYGVDAPEKAQAFGTKARQFTADMLFQKEVTIVIHATDRYGRIVGEVLLPDGRSLSQELVKAGMAWWYRPYAAKDTTLAQLEAETRAAQRWLWADAHPMPPWAWRRET